MFGIVGTEVNQQYAPTLEVTSGMVVNTIEKVKSEVVATNKTISLYHYNRNQSIKIPIQSNFEGHSYVGTRRFAD